MRLQVCLQRLSTFTLHLKLSILYLASELLNRFLFPQPLSLNYDAGDSRGRARPNVFRLEQTPRATAALQELYRWSDQNHT